MSRQAERGDKTLIRPSRRHGDPGSSELVKQPVPRLDTAQEPGLHPLSMAANARALIARFSHHSITGQRSTPLPSSDVHQPVPSPRQVQVDALAISASPSSPSGRGKML